MLNGKYSTDYVQAEISGQAGRRRPLARRVHPAMGGVARRTSADLVHGRRHG